MTIPSSTDDRRSLLTPAVIRLGIRLYPWLLSFLLLTTCALVSDLNLVQAWLFPALIILPLLSHKLIEKHQSTFRGESAGLLLDSALLGCVAMILHPGLPVTGCLLLILLSSGISVRGLTFALIQAILFTTGFLLTWAINPGELMISSSTLMTSVAYSGLVMFALFQGWQLNNREQQYKAQAKQAKEKLQQQSWLTSSMSKYLSPQVRDLIYKGSQTMTGVETRRRRLTVFFSDIEGFTQLSDELEPDAISCVLNHYLDEMSKIALRHGGTIDKFIGDSVMVFFGDPVSQGDRKNAKAALAMAIDMRRQLKGIRKFWRSQGITQPLNIRMGICTGYCNVGNFGTRDRMDYTIVGRAVNLASRLESMADSNEILISEETHSLVEEQILCRRRPPIAVKGIHQPVPVYEVIDFRRDLGARSTWLDEELQGFSLYLDTNQLQPIQRVKALKALSKAAKQLKEQVLHNEEA